MRFKVLKDFNYGPDGINHIRLVEGDEYEIDSKFTEGLLKEKLIATVSVIPAKTAK